MYCFIAPTYNHLLDVFLPKILVVSPKKKVHVKLQLTDTISTQKLRNVKNSNGEAVKQMAITSNQKTHALKYVVSHSLLL